MTSHKSGRKKNSSQKCHHPTSPVATSQYRKGQWTPKPLIILAATVAALSVILLLMQTKKMVVWGDSQDTNTGMDPTVPTAEMDHSTNMDHRTSIDKTTEMDPNIPKIYTTTFQSDAHHPEQPFLGRPQHADDGSFPPGEMGHGVVIDESKLTLRQKKLREELRARNPGFDEFVSRMVSPDRKLPDFRGDWCKTTYPEEKANLSPASVVICFHNEAFSTLARTVHSVVNRTPEKLLFEVLLLDDASEFDSQLDELVAKFPKIIKLYRLKERHGLVRCRMAGIEKSGGKVLVFLDSHMEVGVGWLPPLLHRIKINPKVIASAVMDIIDPTTFAYSFDPRSFKSQFQWDLAVKQQFLSRRELSLKVNYWDPHPTPVYMGPFAVGKKWLLQLGSFDEDMEVLGGENLELSVKTWMCGGRVEVVSCSRVGNVFTTQRSFQVDAKRNMAYNSIRVAQVWMDQFKFLAIDRLGKHDQILLERLRPLGTPEDNLGNFVNIGKRNQLRKSLEICNNTFAWYLDEVVRMSYYNLLGAGEIKNEGMGFCLEQNDQMMGSVVYLNRCHQEAGNQYWYYDEYQRLLRDYGCIGLMPDKKTLGIVNCNEAVEWNYDKDTKRMMLVEEKTSRCLTVGEYEGVYAAQVVKCSKKKEDKQKWVFSQYKSRGIKYRDLADER